MVERLLEDPEDDFDDKTLSNFRLLHNRMLQLTQELQPPLQRPTKASRSITDCSATDLCLTLFCKRRFSK